jgi:beta-glucanase (GH16 family)
VLQEQRFSFTFGTVEARIRFHSYHGAHGAVWLQASEDYIPGQAEIDIAEYYGVHWPGRPEGIPLHHSVHWRKPGALPGEESQAGFTSSSLNFGRWDRWHDYKLHWYPSGYVFYVDGTKVGELVSGLSDRPKFLVLSLLTSAYEEHALEVGHKYGHTLPVMCVKWIRVWDDYR